jgi:hypothetical protein
LPFCREVYSCEGSLLVRRTLKISGGQELINPP